MVGLLAFLTARLDEDEVWLRDDRSPVTDELRSRMFREVAAKRARHALMDEAIDEMDKLIADDDAGRSDQAVAIGRCQAATVAVKHDVAVYSDHPDYQQKWAP